MKSAMSETITSSQKHGIPALLSLFVPGLGQIVKGQVGKGILTFIAVPLGLLFLVVPGIIIWIWNVSDAYNN
jgi:TM2 domain-containing membrane protein YozV